MFAKKEESSQILLVLSVEGMAEWSATIAMAEVNLSLTRTHAEEIILNLTVKAGA